MKRLLQGRNGKGPPTSVKSTQERVGRILLHQPHSDPEGIPVFLGPQMCSTDRPEVSAVLWYTNSWLSGTVHEGTKLNWSWESQVKVREPKRTVTVGGPGEFTEVRWVGPEYLGLIPETGPPGHDCDSEPLHHSDPVVTNNVSFVGV